MKIEKKIYLVIVLLGFVFCAVFLSTNIVNAENQQLPDLAPLPSPAPAEPTLKDLPLGDPPLNEPPKTYPGQVIIKYTQDYKESRDDGMAPDQKVLTATVVGTIYPEYGTDYRGDKFFSGTYLFKEGQMSWSYNAKNYDSSGASCEYLTTSVGSGNIDIAHTDKIFSDSKIWLENDGEYTIDINNDGRTYLAADGLPIVEGDYNSAIKPLQLTNQLISGNSKLCSGGGTLTHEVPPGVSIRLENLKKTKNILSGSKMIPSQDVKEMVSYTIELPVVKNGDTTPEEPAISNDNPDKQGLLEIFWNWIKNIF
jgi:hypothetical protein